MKNKSLLVLLPFALIVTGCNGLKKGSIFNKKFMIQNFDSVPVALDYEVKTPEKVELNLGEGVNAVKENTGGSADILTVSKDGIYARYCLSTNSYTIPFSAEVTSFPSQSILTPEGGFRMYRGEKTVDGKTITVIYDDYGNKIYEGTKTGYFQAPAATIKRAEAEGEEYIKQTIILGEHAVAYAFYNADRTFKEALTSEELLKKYPYESYGESLAEYGHKNLRYSEAEVANETRYSVYNTKKGKYVSSFVIPQAGADGAFKVGNKIIYQTLTTLPKRAEKYDVSMGDTKYNVNTFAVNYLNGKVSKIKTDLLLSTASSIDGQKDAKGVIKYSFLKKVQTITENKTVSTLEKDVIVNNKLKVVADVTGVDYMSLKFFDDEHLISSKNVIYDLKLQETGVSDSGTNIVEVNGKKALIDYSGKYIASPIYDDIQLITEKKFYMFETSDAYKIGKINDKGAVEWVKELAKTDYEPYALKGGNFEEFKIFTKKSDSSQVMFNVTTGEEVTRLEKEDGSDSLNMMYESNNYYTTLVGTMKFYNQAYRRADGSYYMIRHYQKTVFGYRPLKK